MKKEVQPESNGKVIPLFKDEFGHVNNHTGPKIDEKEVCEFPSFLSVRHQSSTGHFIESVCYGEKNDVHQI